MDTKPFDIRCISYDSERKKYVLIGGTGINWSSVRQAALDGVSKEVTGIACEYALGVLTEMLPSFAASKELPLSASERAKMDEAWFVDLDREAAAQDMAVFLCENVVCVRANIVVLVWFGDDVGFREVSIDSTPYRLKKTVDNISRPRK